MSLNVINPYQTFKDSTGAVRAGGFIRFFENNTTVDASIFSDEALTIAQSNPYELNAFGQIEGDVKYEGLTTLQISNFDGSDVRVLNDVATLPTSANQSSSFVPDADDTYDIGAIGFRWKDFYMAGAIKDTSGNEILTVAAAASAVNQASITNAATGNDPILGTVGDDTNVGLILDTQGTGDVTIKGGSNEIIIANPVGSAVNEVTVSSAITTEGPTIAATGDDANIDLNLEPQGSGNVILNDSSSNEVVIAEGVASAVNEVTISNAIITTGPDISATGSETNIDLNLNSKGNSSVSISGGSNEVIIATSISSAVNEVTVTNSISAVGPTIATTGDDANIDLNLTTKGSGDLNLDVTTGNVALTSSSGDITADGIILNPPEVTGHHRAGNTQLTLLPSASSFSVSSATALLTFETWGPTGSGATNIWSAMDDMPSNAAILIINVEILNENDGGTTQSTVEFFATDGDVTTPTAASVIKAASLYVPNVAGSGRAIQQSYPVDVPVNSSQVFKATWDESNASTGTVTMYYGGFRTD